MSMSYKHRGIALFACVLCFCFNIMLSLPVHGQVSGATLSGTITDPQGAAVPNAKVTIRNGATGVSAETSTNGAGFYSAPNLNPGDYEVTASAAGFNTATAKLTLTVGQKEELNIPLAVGQLAQAVEVTSSVPQVDLESSSISGNVNATTVRELPLNGRDWASLATLEPGVEESRVHLDISRQGGGGGRGLGDQLSIDGNRPHQNSYRLDGALVNDYSNAGPGSVLGANLGVDAIEEFTVLTSNYSAEYGFTSGGVINAITRSGTNTFHGTAFDFLRNDAFDATNFFSNANALPKNPLKQNQFGAAGGWKILKDRLFLFGDYEGVRRSAGLPLISCGSGAAGGGLCTTLSPAVRAGSVVNLNTGATVQVPVDANIQKMLALYPQPTPGAACIPVTVTGPLKGQCNPNIAPAPFQGAINATENFYTNRVDYKISAKDNAFVTYLRDSSIYLTPLTFNNERASFTSYRQAVIAEETHVFSAAWVNSFRIASDRTGNLGSHVTADHVINPAAADPSLGVAPGLYSPEIFITGAGLPTLPGGVGGGISSEQDYHGNIYQLYDDAFWTHGTHSVKFGGDFIDYELTSRVPPTWHNGLGRFLSTGIETVAGGSNKVPTGAEGPCLRPGQDPTKGTSYDVSCGALVNFLSDQPNVANPPGIGSFSAQYAIGAHYLRSKVFSGYIQDDWRLRSNLTVNLGIRYEAGTTPVEKYGNIAQMPSIYTQLPCLPVGDPRCSQLAPETALRNSFWTHNPTTKNFEPRIGFAWDPFHNGKTSVRGGFGVFDALPLGYELALGNEMTDPYWTTWANFGSLTLASTPSVAAGTAASTRGEWPYIINNANSFHVLNPTSRSFYYTDANIKRNYVYQYNLNIQRQITPSTTILIGYAGSRAYHNPFQSDSANSVLPTLVSGVGYVWPVPYTGSLTSSAQILRLLNPTVNGIHNTMWESRSWYNSMVVKVDKRMSHGFQLQGSFTWSKSIDDESGSFAGDTFELDDSSQPWYDLRLDKGLSDFDVRRNLTISGLWNVPTTKSLGALGEKVLGGWQLGLIIHAGDGIPEPLFIGSDLGGELQITAQPPNLVPGCSQQSLANPSSTYRTNGLRYVNSNCLSLVPLTATNAPYCDSANRGIAAALASTICANIRGNLGRDVVIGPGLFNVDSSLFKNNYVRKISETFNVQFRAEFFNILNHTNFAPSPNTSPFNSDGTPTAGFGQLTSTQGDNRVIQLALKAIW
jgi:hypothetical protein